MVPNRIYSFRPLRGKFLPDFPAEFTSRQNWLNFVDLRYICEIRATTWKSRNLAKYDKNQNNSGKFSREKIIELCQNGLARSTFLLWTKTNIIFFVISVDVEDYRHFFETFFTRSMVNCCAIFLAMCKQIPRSVLLLNLLAQAFKACCACTKAKT